MLTINWLALTHRAGAIASALAGRGVPPEVVEEVLHVLLALPERPPTPPAAPPAPPSAAGATPAERKKPGPKKAKSAALEESAFGPCLRRVLRERGVSHKQFAEKAGLRGAVPKIFSRATANPDTVAKYAAAIGCTPAELWPSGCHARQPGACNGGPRPRGEAGASDGESGPPWQRCRPPPDADPEHLRAVAEEIHRHAKEHREQLRRVLAEAREMYRRETGKKLTNLHPAFRVGDHTDLPGFERIARTLADRYPGWLGPHGYERGDNDSTKAAEKLWELLTAGVPECRLAAAYQQAAEMLTFFHAAGDAPPDAGPTQAERDAGPAGAGQ